MMKPRDSVALFGIIATLIVSLANLLYMIRNSRKTAFVNTVTTSRLKWIESLRDKVSSFIAITQRILSPQSGPKDTQNFGALLRERDTLMHQIILHLNPNDREDQAIQHAVERVVALTSSGNSSPEIDGLLVDLRNATQVYLKKEWTRVKRESRSGEQR